MFKVFNIKGDSLELKKDENGYRINFNKIKKNKDNDNSESFLFNNKYAALELFVELKNKHNMKPMNDKIKKVSKKVYKKMSNSKRMGVI